MTELRLKEVFSSLQGEGVLIGRRQLFVRLADCNLACAYCDTDYADAPIWHAEERPGGAGRREFPNPVTAGFLTGMIADWQAHFPLHHSLALTGGEPLVQEQALGAWLPAVADILPIYLETNGTLPEALEAVLPWVTWVSMDIKLAATTGSPTPWDAHAAFLKTSAEKTCQVKVVIDADTPESDIVETARFVQCHAPRTPLILQPRTVGRQPTLTGRRLLTLQEIAAREHSTTLIIPQVHPLLAIR